MKYMPKPKPKQITIDENAQSKAQEPDVQGSKPNVRRVFFLSPRHARVRPEFDGRLRTRPD